MTVSLPPEAGDFMECLSWRSFQLKRNAAAEKRLRTLLGCGGHLDAETEALARRSKNPEIQQAFKLWLQTEEDFSAADVLLEEAKANRAMALLNTDIKNLDC